MCASAPGYQVNVGRDGDVLVILRTGGTKKRQQYDIEKARPYWRMALSGAEQ